MDPSNKNFFIVGNEEKIEKNLINNKLIGTLYIYYDEFFDIKEIKLKNKEYIYIKIEKFSIFKDLGNDNLFQVLEIVSQSDFLIGNTLNSKWKAYLDWFIENDNNWIKELVGKYLNEDSIND